MNKKIIITIAAAGIAFIALFAYIFLNKESVVSGKILEITGLVEVKKKNSKDLVKVFENMAFTEGDVLFTREDGRAHLEIDESKDVQVAPNTELAFTELKSSINAAQGKTHLELKEGKVKIKISEKLKGDSKFQIETPNAIMGVMGTEFYVYHDENGTYVGVIEGEVEVTKANGEKVVLVPKGKAVLITNDGQVEEMDLTPEKEAEFFENATRIETPDGMAEFVLQENEDNNDPEPTPPEEPLSYEGELIAIGDENQGPVTVPEPEPTLVVTPEPVLLPEPIPEPEPVPLPEPIPQPSPQQPDDELKQAKNQLYQVLNTAKAYLTDNRIPAAKKQELQQLINTATQVYETGTVAQIREVQASLTSFLAQLNEDFESLTRARTALYEEMEKANNYIQKDELSSKQKTQLEKLITEATDIYTNSTDTDTIQNIRNRLTEHLSYLDELLKAINEIKEVINKALNYMQYNELLEQQKVSLQQLIDEAKITKDNSTEIAPIQNKRSEIMTHLSILDEFIQAKKELYGLIAKATSYLQNEDIPDVFQLQETMDNAKDSYDTTTSTEELKVQQVALKLALTKIELYFEKEKAYAYYRSGLFNQEQKENIERAINEANYIIYNSEDLIEVQEMLERLKSYLSEYTYEFVLDFIQAREKLYELIDNVRYLIDISSEQDAEIEEKIGRAEEVYFNSKDIEEIKSMIGSLSNVTLTFAKKILNKEIGSAVKIIEEEWISDTELAELSNLVSQGKDIYNKSTNLDEILSAIRDLKDFLSSLDNYDVIQALLELSQLIEKAEKYLSELKSSSDYERLYNLWSNLDINIKDAKEVLNDSTDVNEIQGMSNFLSQYLSDLEEMLKLYNELLKAEALIASGTLNEAQFNQLEELIMNGWETFVFEFISEAVPNAQQVRDELLQFFTNLGITDETFEFLMAKYELSKFINYVWSFKSPTGDWYIILPELTKKLDDLLVEATNILDTSSIEQIEEVREMYKKLYSKFALAKSISQAEEVYNWSDYITDEQREELNKLIKDGKEIYETSDLALHLEIAENLEKLLSEILG